MVGLSVSELKTLEVLLSESEVAQAQATMCSSPYLSLRSVVCEKRGEVLVLRGHVETFHLKQLAQETVRRHVRQYLIANNVTVD